jgi:DNA ligase D-like protein (predicted 3'-phosphoesterase)
MGSDERLEEYRSKRRFDRTSEPSGAARPKKGEKPRFVVQKHKASTLHYDFRIEVDGVLKSWAVPKGPSTDPAVKRLAVPTEDHPLDYIDFEGVIPEGEYGAGEVIVWDTGTYRNMKEKPVAEAIRDGQAEIRLEGKKLQGGYALIRTGKGDNVRWLLIKMRDDEADARRNPVRTQPESVLTGRTIEDIEGKEDAG